MSLTGVVPTIVPSLFHNSWPLVASFAVKNRVPFTLVKNDGKLLFPPGCISRTRTVPALVPLLFQSSVPADVLARHDTDALEPNFRSDEAKEVAEEVGRTTIAADDAPASAPRAARASVAPGRMTKDPHKRSLQVLFVLVEPNGRSLHRALPR